MILSKKAGPEGPRGSSINRNGPAAVGRPKRGGLDDRGVHDALLVAADECLISEASTRVPVRRIAAKAGVNQAMVNYYFSSKSGLFLALFESQLSKLVRELKALLKKVSQETDNLDLDCSPVEEIISIIEKNFSNSPALFVMGHDDMFDSGSEIFTAYRERFGARAYSTIVRIMAVLIKRGICRADISASDAAYFICCTSAMPFLVSPIFEKAFDSKADGQAAEHRRRAAAQLLKAPG